LNECLHAWRIDFFILAGNPKTSYANKLIITLGNLTAGCVLIEVGECKVEGLLLEFEAQMHID